MPVTIVVGGQYGSEGKGKVVSAMADTIENSFVVRCGGPNSGHTIDFNESELVLRQIPAGVGSPSARLGLAAGCVVDVDVLISELDILSLPPERVIVDPRVVLIDPEDIEEEKTGLSRIASTCSGVGAALIRRMHRSPHVKFAKDSERLHARTTIKPVAPMVHTFLDAGGHVLVEGTQGFGLSLLHGFHYPHVTARDTTASGFAMEVGLSPRQIGEVVMVIRTFPIRVGGTSGPLKDEISWEEVARLSGAPSEIPEYTSVTNRLRRVARFDLDAVKIACMYNRPTSIALMGLDRLDYANHEVLNWSELTEAAQSFISKVVEETGVPVSFVGTGFQAKDIISISSRTRAEVGSHE